MMLHSGTIGSTWMTAASMETMLELWASALRDAKARIRPLFTQARVAASAGLFLDGLLGPERRKTGWMRAEAAGEHARLWEAGAVGVGCGLTGRGQAGGEVEVAGEAGCGAASGRDHRDGAGLP